MQLINKNTTYINIKEKINFKIFAEITLYIYVWLLSFLNYTPFYILAGVVFMFTMLIYQKKIIYNNFSIFLLLLLLLFYTHSALFSISKMASLKMCVTLTFNYLITIFIISYFSDGDTFAKIRRFGKVYLFISLFVGCFILAYTKGQGSTGRLAHGFARPFSSTAYLSQEIGDVFAIGIIFAIYNINKTRNNIRVLYLISICFLIYLLILTGARSSFLLLFITLYIFFALKMFKKGMVYFIAYLLLSLCLCLVLYECMIDIPYLYDKIGYRFESIVESVLSNTTEFSESSAASRQWLMDTTRKLIKENPLIGYGISTSDFYLGAKMYAHNNFLELSYACGIIFCLFYYLGFVLMFIRLIKKYLKKSSCTLWLCLALLVTLLMLDYVNVSYLERTSYLYYAIIATIAYRGNGKYLVLRE